MPASISRRRFLARTASGLAAAAVVGPQSSQAAPAKGEARMSIIDPHQHLWDLQRFQPPWLKGEPKLNRSHTMADYLRAAERLGIEKTVYMEIDVDPSQQVAEA